jgi:hypothetical protein
MTNHTFKTGESREQGCFLPPRIEDYVGPDNPVRAIESFVGALDLAKLGFRHADRGVEVGQPPYDPADLLKLYLYGYINQIRSSRRLEREACRNLELIWLLKNLRPGYRTIANFNRASFGVQEFDPKVQAAINRIQPPEMVERAVGGLRAAGVPNINFDLIYGLPHQTTAALCRTVEQCVAMKPDRVALFGYAHVPWVSE